MELCVAVSDDKLAHQFLQFLCDKHEIHPEKLNLISVEDLPGAWGMCIDDSEREFTIFIKEGSRNITEIFNTISHEMIHVKQFMKQELGKFLGNGEDYMDCWWEKEAFGNSMSYVYEFANYIRNK